MPRQINWIPEKEAAAKLGYQPETLRRYAKSGRIIVNYTSVRGRNFQYDEKSIDTLLLRNAVIV